MFTYFLSRLSRGWRVAILALLAICVLPDFAFAVAFTEVLELFKYSYGADKMMYLASLETVIYTLLKKRKKKVSGRGQWIIPFQKQTAGVMKGGPEGDTLTTKRAQPDTAEAVHSLIEFEIVWDITWKMLRNATKSEDAFEKALDFMDRSVKHRVFRVINAMVCSMTGRGELAILPAADDQATITINSLGFFDQGMRVDLMDATDDTTAILSDVTVDDIDVQARTVTVSEAASGTAAGDYFVVADTEAGGVNYSMLGLGAWIDDANPPAVVGNLGGINRSTAGNSFYRGNVLSNSGTLRAFTEDLLIQGENLIRERGGVQPDRYAANGNILARYNGDVIKDRYFALNIGPQATGADGPVGFGRKGTDLDGGENSIGKTHLQLSGKPFHCEPYLRANHIIGWADDHFFIGHDGIETPTPLSDIFDDMISYFTMTTSKKFDVWHYWEANLISDNPQAGIKFEDVAES